MDDEPKYETYEVRCMNLQRELEKIKQSLATAQKEVKRLREGIVKNIYVDCMCPTCHGLRKLIEGGGGDDCLALQKSLGKELD